MARKTSEGITNASGVSTEIEKNIQGVEHESRLGLLKSRLKIAKAWAKKPHEAWRAYIDEYEISDIGDTEEVRDKIQIGYIFRRVESDLPAIFDDQPELFFKGKKGKTKLLEPLFESTYDWLWDNQTLEETIEDAATYFLLLGMGFVESPWVTKTKKVQEPVLDEMGQPVIDEMGQPLMQEYEAPIIDQPKASILDPFKVFFSPETKFNPVLDYEHCPYYLKEEVMTVEEVEARFGKKVDPTEKLKINDLDVDSEIDKVTEEVKDDMKRVTVYEYCGCLPKVYAKEIKGDGWSYDKEYHVFFTSNEELKAEELPYPVKPLFILGNYGMANKFWKFGDAKHLKPLVDELEQYRVQILKHTRKMANPKPLIPNECDVDMNDFNDPRVGRPVKYTPAANGAKPEYLAPSELGASVGVGIEMARTDLEQTSGAFSLAQGSGVSQVKTPRGIQEYSEASDKNVRRKRKKIARFIRHLILFQFKLLGLNWRPEDNRTLEVMNPDAEGGAEDLPITAEVLQLLGDDNLVAKMDIEVESLSVNRVQMKQDALELWDLAIKTPPGVFNLPEIGKWLLQTGFGMKDGDRFMMTEEQRQQLAQPQAEPPRVNVSIKADATTPPGAALLENEGLLQQGQGVQAVVDNQMIEQATGEAQAQQQADTQMQQSQIQNDHQTEQTVMNAALRPQPEKKGGSK